MARLNKKRMAVVAKAMGFSTKTQGKQQPAMPTPKKPKVYPAGQYRNQPSDY